mmetsp:Transcript_74141/g.206077  ORF Transcript_74141/g.206077 Transcript_74141/m.206077 type:complete len:277 (-) Transcript_74141:1360-2190(-)
MVGVDADAVWVVHVAAEGMHQEVQLEAQRHHRPVLEREFREERPSPTDVQNILDPEDVELVELSLGLVRLLLPHRSLIWRRLHAILLGCRQLSLLLQKGFVLRLAAVPGLQAFLPLLPPGGEPIRGSQVLDARCHLALLHPAPDAVPATIQFLPIVPDLVEAFIPLGHGELREGCAQDVSGDIRHRIFPEQLLLFLGGERDAGRRLLDNLLFLLLLLLRLQLLQLLHKRFNEGFAPLGSFPLQLLDLDFPYPLRLGLLALPLGLSFDPLELLLSSR